MSTRRITAGVFSSPTPLGPNGERLCRNCHGPMPPGKRKHNCSKKCVEEWGAKTSPTVMRERILERDKGICALCGVDVFEGKTWPNGSPRMRRARGSGDLWQADHIKPVIEGGGECGLENFRTVCTPCHKRVTKELSGRMAARRHEKRVIENDQARGLFASL